MEPWPIRRLYMYNLRAPNRNAKWKVEPNLRKHPPAAPNPGKGNRRSKQNERKRSQRKRTRRWTSFLWNGLRGLSGAKIPICASEAKPFSLSIKPQYFIYLFIYYLSQSSNLFKLTWRFSFSISVCCFVNYWVGLLRYCHCLWLVAGEVSWKILCWFICLLCSGPQEVSWLQASL